MAADSFPAALPPPAKMSTTSQRRCRQLRPFWLAVALSLWTATAAGLLHASESNLDETTWSYEASVGFCLDILTSAGLAAASEPHTAAGRLVCLFYGLTALPAFIIFLLSTGGRLASALRLATVGLGRLCRRRQAWRQLWPDRPDGPGVPVWLPAVFLIIWVPLAAALLQLTGAASNYGEAVWIHLSALLSFGTAGRLSAAVRPVDFALRLTGLVLIAATVAVATDHIKAAEAQLAALVNGSYLAAISADGQMPPLRQIRTGLGRAARFWASLGNRRSAVELWRSRAQMQSAATQSRESSFSPRVYGVGAAPGDFCRSRDDVSRLMATVDARLLRPAPDVTSVPGESNKSGAVDVTSVNSIFDPQSSSALLPTTDRHHSDGN